VADRGGRRLRAIAERRALVETLRVQPEVACPGPVERGRG